MSRRDQFETIRTEGALLPADLLQRVRERDKELGGLRGEDYGLPPNEPLNEAIVRSYNRLVGAWASFREARSRLPEDEPGTTITRDRWLLVLLQELGYGRVQTAPAVEIDGKAYPVSHAWGNNSIHLVGCNIKLDRRTRGVAGAATQTPHGTVQELLNRSDERLWGVVSNGLQFRLLRDNSSLTRQAYVEFDLEQMMDGEAYADFVLLWMVCHASRVEGAKPHECWLERWSQEAAKQGTRALDGLRKGVEAAITALGSGFLTPGRNPELKTALRHGELSTQDYYRELLRLVYRLLFLFVAEDRGLLHHPGAPEEARTRYARWYSTRRLRDLAERRRGTKHGDLWAGIELVMHGLSDDDGCRPLGLPALGSFLWSERALLHLDGAHLPNRSLLEAVRALATVREGNALRAVDYKNLGAEELGSVYESLLELHPRLDADAGTFTLDTAAGNERKTTGSYYTPTSLISTLLDSALDPVLDAAAAKGEEAILDLKIVDPACGSGHFLVAAAHRIAKRLASARTGDEEPSPEATRKALRDVVSRCIYGVDINPMAVELCKVSLWVEALDPGRPLSFLDAHIKCGNSLLGATPALVASGIADDAFKTFEGDDKAVTTELRKRNRREQAGQLTLEDEVAQLETELHDLALELEQGDDTSPEKLHAKEERYRQLIESNAYERQKLLADAWCSAFVQHKQAGRPQITEGTLRVVADDPAKLATETRAAIEALTDEYAFFHWHVEFPQMFGVPEPGEVPENDQTGWSGGFDCVLGNPPWERLKLQEKEFFAERSPQIAAAPNKAARERMIKRLKEEDPTLDQAFRDALRRSDGESHLVRVSGRYPLAGRGDVNTYAIFAELMRSTISTTGRVGCILPLGVATDDTTKHFFGDLVQRCSLVSLYGFENEEFIFPAVHHATKFCLLTLTGSARPAGAAEFVFFARQVTALDKPERRFTLAPDDFALLNPNTRTCPIFRSRRDAELTKAIYRRVPVLVDESRSDGGNPWGVTFMAMFHMANDSGLFHTQEQLESDGWRLDGNVFRRGTDAYMPLYEAKMIYHFDHRFGTYRGQTEAQANQGKLPELTDEQHADPAFLTLPRYWVAEREIDAKLGGKWSARWLLGWRNITGVENARTIIATVLPRVAVGHSMPLVCMTRHSLAAPLLANFDTFILDYVARQKLGGKNLTFFIINQLAVIPPGSGNGVVTENWIAARVLELTYTASDMRPFACDLGYEGPPFRWDADRRFLLRRELDAAFFHLYGLARDDVDHVMNTFPIVRDRDVKAHGEYRTKRVILEIYDELADAIDRGVPYETRLDPPPADPRVAQAPRAESVEVPV
ncbi:MAG TPA: N-6 DNA methylase [Gaiellaceae bacterium]|nr:N-6 DNA methylase [Gaiellaceae bacterium]